LQGQYFHPTLRIRTHIFPGDIFIIPQGKKLLDHSDPVAAHKVTGDGNIFTRSFGSARTQCEVFDLAGPANIRTAIKRFMPPFLIDLTIIMRSVLYFGIFFLRVC
jgi:hypothetical protein